jgi:hypothetical protein
MSILTRRGFIGNTAVAIGSFDALQKVVGAGHPSDPGPANPALNGQNPDSMWPPGTDSKSLVQNFKYSFSFANKRVDEGRRRIRAEELAALRREHGRHRFGVPRDIQGRSLSGPFILGVAGSHPAGTCHGALTHRQSHLRYDTKEWRFHNAAIVGGLYANK